MTYHDLASVRLSVCPIMRPQPRCAAGLRLITERRVYTTSGAAALVTARHSAANASSVTFTAHVAIRKVFTFLIPTLVSAGDNYCLLKGAM